MWRDLVHQLRPALSDLGNELSFAPPWAVSVMLVVGVTVAAWLIHAAVVALMLRLLRGRRPYLRSILEQAKYPTRLALLLIAVGVTLPTMPTDPATKALILRFLVLGTICVVGWFALIALHIGANLYLFRFQTGTVDNLLARKHLTQVRVLVRVLDTVIFLVTLGFALMTFDAVRQYGISLFASAGVAGVVFGLAAQPVLSNLIAGVQLAITQPIRLEDAVTVQNEYGWIEEIYSTYVVIRLWDLRRLIVPLNFFIQQPFYNWTRRADAPFGSVVLYLDFAAPVDLIRKKAAELVAQSPRDNVKVLSVQVTNARPDSIELRVLVASGSSGTTSDVCADLREQLIAYIQREHPEALPRQRSEDAAVAARQKAEPPATIAQRKA